MKYLLMHLKKMYRMCAARTTLFSDQTEKKWDEKLETDTAAVCKILRFEKVAFLLYSIYKCGAQCTLSQSHSMIDTHLVVMNCNSAKANFPTCIECLWKSHFSLSDIACTKGMSTVLIPLYYSAHTHTMKRDWNSPINRLRWTEGRKTESA